MKTKATRTEQIWLKGDEITAELCHIAKNLYNEANYIIRQEFFKSGKWIRYNELNKRLKDSENYKALPAQTAQQTLKLVDKAWKSFFKAIREWKKHPEKFFEQPLRDSECFKAALLLDLFIGIGYFVCNFY